MTEVNQILEFQDYPKLGEVVRDGGYPGVSYAYILGQNIGKVRRLDEGWVVCRYARDFEIGGESFVVMCKGDPIPGASNTSCRPELFVDTEGPTKEPTVGKEKAKAKEAPQAQAASPS